MQLDASHLAQQRRRQRRIALIRAIRQQRGAAGVYQVDSTKIVVQGIGHLRSTRASCRAIGRARCGSRSHLFEWLPGLVWVVTSYDGAAGATGRGQAGRQACRAPCGQTQGTASRPDERAKARWQPQQCCHGVATIAAIRGRAGPPCRGCPPPAAAPPGETHSPLSRGRHRWPQTWRR